MDLIYFIVFFIVSWLILMKIFSFTTYHKYFYKALPILLIYATLLGYLLDRFEFHKFFLWFLIINIVLFIKIYKRDFKQDLVEGFVEDYNNLLPEEQTKKIFQISKKNTLKYFIISSIIYLTILQVTYFIFLNEHLWR